MTSKQDTLHGASPAQLRGPRAERTGWAALVATGVLVVGGALLYDVIAVRTGHRARAWRAEVARQLSTRHLDDRWVLIGAGVAVIIGLVLCRLAFARGLRHWLPLRRQGAVIDRAGVAVMIATRAQELPGVETTAVRVSRSRTKVTVSGTADPVSVQRELRAELGRVPLARPNRLDVRVRARRHPHGGDHHHRRLAEQPRR